jgi:acetyl-CoA C-acetyltransferase
MNAREIVLCEAVRTPIGTYDGSLKSVPAADLGAVAIKALLNRSKLDPAKIGTVVMGNVIQAGNKMNPARQSAVNGGIPVDVPAMTVNRVCGSGAQAIASAAQEIMLGMLDSAIAGGTENMDMAPYLVANGRWGYRMGDAQMYDSMLRDGLNDAFSGEHSGWHTEDLAKSRQITREQQDRWALRSQQRFSAAQAAGKFKNEITPVELHSRKGPKVFDKDEHNRPDTTLESLAKLHPAFRKDGTITAGNAPGLNSGGAAGARTRRLEDWRYSAHRDQRSIRRDRHCGHARTWSCRGHRQCRRRRHRPRPPDRCDRRGTDHAPSAFDEARRRQARRCHALYRRRPRHRADDRGATLIENAPA